MSRLVNFLHLDWLIFMIASGHAVLMLLWNQ